MEPLLNILIIDDNIDDHLTYQRLLRKNSLIRCDITSAYSGKEGLACCEKQSFDCIFLDYSLPDLTGLQVLEVLIKKNETLPLPIIMITGQGDIHIAVEAMKCGAQDYIEKGRITASTLSLALSSAMNKAMRKKAELKLAENLKQLERQNRELARSNSDLENFAFIASHDLKEPLRKIIGYSLRIKNTLGNLSEKSIEELEKVIQSAERMQKLIGSLLDYSRVLSHQPKRERINLSALIKDIWSDFEERVDETQATLLVEFLPDMLGDEMLIRQLFQNLISNALKYRHSERKPVIRIFFKENFESDHFSLCVEDNGIGFDEKYSEYIFGVFKRLHSRADYEGTGIGLALCQRIVSCFHGVILPKSEEGKGSCFIIQLPVTLLLASEEDEYGNSNQGQRSVTKNDPCFSD